MASHREMRAAAEGSIRYALRAAGWTDEQIHNGLATYRASVLNEAADEVADPQRRTGLGWESARYVLHSMADDVKRLRTY